jgi:hypothetical protein
LSASVYLTPGGFAPNSDHELIALQRTYYLSTTYIWDGTVCNSAQINPSFSIASLANLMELPTGIRVFTFAFTSSLVAVHSKRLPSLQAQLEKKLEIRISANKAKGL